MVSSEVVLSSSGAAPSQETLTGTVSSGSLSLVGSSITATLKNIIVIPATSTTTWKINIKETTTGYDFITPGKTFTGTRIIYPEICIISDTYTIDLSSVSVDEAFTVLVRYV